MYTRNYDKVPVKIKKLINGNSATDYCTLIFESFNILLIHTVIFVKYLNKYGTY